MDWNGLGFFRVRKGSEMGGGKLCIMAVIQMRIEFFVGGVECGLCAERKVDAVFCMEVMGQK